MFGNYYGYPPAMYSPSGAMSDNASQLRTPYQPQSNTQSNSGLLWVQGEAGAKSFLVAPGQSVLLMDSENSRFYLKSADASGMPLPLRIFDYKECTETHAQPTQTSAATSTISLDNFVTRDELEKRLASISSQCQCRKKEEDVTDGN